MKKNVILSGLTMLFATLIFSGCNNDEPQLSGPSPRDGVYEGENLTVTIDGEIASSIKSITISSKKIPYAQGIIVGDNGSNGGNSNPVFDTSVIFNGFLGNNEDTTLKTVSTLYYFDGKFSISEDDDVQFYEYSGTFTGDPNAPHSEQGLILEFTSIENPT